MPQEDEKFLTEVFAQLTDEATEDSKRRELVCETHETNLRAGDKHWGCFKLDKVIYNVNNVDRLLCFTASVGHELNIYWGFQSKFDMNPLLICRETIIGLYYLLNLWK